MTTFGLKHSCQVIHPTLAMAAGHALASRARDNPEQSLVEELFCRFREKFGRDPCPNDPLFFDPDANEPVPLRESIRILIWDELADEMARDGEITAADAYAMKKTGLLASESTKHLLDNKQLAEWSAAVREYQRQRAAKAIVVDNDEAA